MRAADLEPYYDELFSQLTSKSIVDFIKNYNLDDDKL